MTEQHTSFTPELQEADIGTTLKSLREAKGLSLEDIYKATMIPVRKLELLEANDFSFLDAPVFVNGYIRSYAKKLGVDSNTMVALYQKGLASNAELNTETLEGVDEHSDDLEVSEQITYLAKKYMLWLIVFVVAMLLAGVLLIFGGRSEQQNAELDLDVDERRQGADKGSSIDEESTIGIGEPTENIDVSSEELSPDLSPDSAGASASESSFVDTSLSAEGALLSQDSGKPDLGARAEEPAPQNLDGDKLRVEPLVSTDQLVNTSQLDFSFSDDCWLEVKDSTGKVIIAQLNYKGDNLRLLGQAPFTIMLGNVHAVELSLDSRPVTIRPKGSAKTLRMTLPPW